MALTIAPCSHCSTPLTPEARFCASCGQAVPATPPAPESDAGPTWPYPEPTTPRSASGDTATIVIMAVLGQLLLGLWLGAVFVVVFNLLRGFSFLEVHEFWLITLFGVPGLVVLFAPSVVKSMRQDSQRRTKLRETIRSGVHCWGRIVDIEQGNYSVTHGGVRTWSAVKITTTAFAATVPNNQPQRHPAGSKVAERIVINAMVSTLQYGHLVPGNWCAFLLHPTDSTITFLDGFATHNGHVSARM